VECGSISWGGEYITGSNHLNSEEIELVSAYLRPT
jgi:hypothetical protein